MVSHSNNISKSHSGTMEEQGQPGEDVIFFFLHPVVYAKAYLNHHQSVGGGELVFLEEYNPLHPPRQREINVVVVLHQESSPLVGGASEH